MNEMLGALLRADQAAFLWMNQKLYWRPLADVAYFLAQDPVLLALLALLTWVYGRRAGWPQVLRCGAPALGALILTQLLQNLWLKPWLHRTRPVLALEAVHFTAPVGDLAAFSYAFPSTHAASAAALAVVAARLDPNLRGPLWGLALAVGLGTILAGGHYPLDVLAGYLVGFGVGQLWLALWPRTWLARKGTLA